jgi:hypothetical protein
MNFSNNLNDDRIISYSFRKITSNKLLNERISDLFILFRLRKL